MKIKGIIIILFVCFICSLQAVAAADVGVNDAASDMLATEDISVAEQDYTLQYASPEESVLGGNGDLVNFTVTVTNHGPSNATGVNVSDVLDGAFAFDSSNGIYNKSNNGIIWNIGELENGFSVSVWVVVRVLTNGTFVNVASVDSTENEIIISNRTNVTVEPVVDLTLSKVSNVSDAKVGDLVNFTVVVTNFGPCDATGVNISDVLDNAFEFVDSDGFESDGKVVWNIGELENGFSVSVWVVVRVLTNGTLVNVASVDSTENEIIISNRTNVTVEPG